MTAVLRDMRWQDIPALTALDAELFADDAWSEPTWWAELAGRPRRDYVVLTDGDDVVAYGGLDHGGEVSDIMSIAVAPAARGRGHARAVLTELERRAADAGADGILLEVRSDNDAARGLYDSGGYDTVHVRRRYYQPGDVDALIMRKRLRDNEGEVT